jgi:hypothetical protein
MWTVVRIVSGGGMVATAASSGPVVVPSHVYFLCSVVVLVKKLG